MNDVAAVLVALVIAAVVFWLLGYAVPTFLAALVALLVFLVLLVRA